MSLWASLVKGASATAGIPTPALAAAPGGTTTTAPPQVAAGLELASPWTSPLSPQLTSIVWADTIGTVDRALMPTTRETAMQVPALARARHLLCGSGAKCPLQAFTRESPTATQPRWLIDTGEGLPAYHRMLWTLDDLLFHGWALWDVQRDSDGGPITGTAARIAAHRWSFNQAGGVLVDGTAFPSKRALLIPGPHEGLLTFGRTAILQAAELEASATRVAQNPAAYLNLHYTGDVPMSETDIDTTIARWVAARRGENGGVAWTGKDIGVEELGSPAEHLLVEGRNAAAVNMARIASVPAALVDATNAGASLTYETTAGRNAEFLDYGLDLYLDALSARLSMDDVVPPRQSVRFDTTVLRSTTPSPTGPVTED
jgi:hypothetical protein